MNQFIESQRELVREIPLTMGKVALVDDDDYERLNKHKWHAVKHRNTYYARRTENKKTIAMHREILNMEKGTICDHINRNGLDNRKQNLRICSHSQNNKNRTLPKSNTSGYRGVYWGPRLKKWEAYIKSDGKLRIIGRFAKKEEAAEAYNKEAIKLNGNFAQLNIITNVTGVE
jgi:hypothetical protein